MKRRALLALLFAGALAACGKRGALRLPTAEELAAEDGDEGEDQE